MGRVGVEEVGEVVSEDATKRSARYVELVYEVAIFELLHPLRHKAHQRGVVGLVKSSQVDL